jgi:hypothetical protein
METYKRIVLPKIAYERLRDPAILKSIAFSKEQQEHIKRLQSRPGLLRYPAEAHPSNAELLAILDPQQQKKLRAEVERNYFAGVESRAKSMAFVDDTELLQLLTVNNAEIAPIVGFEPAPVEKAAEPFFLLPVYRQLGARDVRKNFGLSEAQENQFQEIASKYETARKKIRHAVKELTPAELNGKWPELWPQSVAAAKELRREIEDLLSPQQLAALKDSIVDAYLFMDLHPDSPDLAGKMGLSDQQIAALRRKWLDSIDEAERVLRDMQEKLFAVLTPEQEQALRREIDRSGW